jgi:ribosomal protein S18 acetylase RimI-like enzyme
MADQVLAFRMATPDDLPRIERMIIDAFEPITWYRKLELELGPLNGVDWRARWRNRLEAVFATQVIMVGEFVGEVVAAATGTYDPLAAMGFVDLLAVDRAHQGRGWGRAMLRAFLDHLRAQGARYCNLECLVDNDPGNALYESEGWRVVARMNRWFVEL